MVSPREEIQRQCKELDTAIFGLEDIIKIFCLSKAADLTILLLGAHGTAKSSLARLWSKTTGMAYRVVTSSEVDESMLAYIDPAVFREQNIVKMRRGELMEKDHIIVDEYFLWLNKYRAKLHQLLEEKTYCGLPSQVKTYTFLSNPLTEYYSGQIPEANMATFDRIDVIAYITQVGIVPSEKMTRKFSMLGRQEHKVRSMVSWKTYQKAHEEILAVRFPSKTLVWLTLFAHFLTSCKHVKDKWTVSLSTLRKMCGGCNESTHVCAKVLLSKPRFLRATTLLAKALAWYSGRDVVTLDDVTEAMRYTLPHRLVWVQEEVSLTASVEKVKELIQEFNDDMLAWKNMGVFRKLVEFVERASSEPPKYDSRQIATLAEEVSEIHVLADFIKETSEVYKQRVVDYYREEGSKVTFQTIRECKAFLNNSGLDQYDISNLAWSLLKDRQMSIRVPRTYLDKLIDILTKEKKEYTREFLERLFEERIELDDDSFMLREENGSLVLVCSDKTERERIERQLVKKNGRTQV